MLQQLVDKRDVFRLVVSKLTLRPLLRLQTVSRGLHATVTEEIKERMPRVVVSSAGNHKIVDLTPEDGFFVAHVPDLRPKRFRYKHEKTENWHTGMAFSPYDGDLYVCSDAVNGVIIFDGKTLEYRKPLFRDAVYNPEGLAFAKNRLYVCNACGGCVSRLSLAGQLEDCLYFDYILPNPQAQLSNPAVPWGMTVGPDEALYIAVDRGPMGRQRFDHYMKQDYPQEAEWTSGDVIRLPLTDDGGFPDVPLSFTHGSNLKRPSGLCFDDVGNLYVTSLTDEVKVFQGPNGEWPGKFIRVAVRTGDGGLSHPWDVKWWKGQLFVAMHAARDDHHHSRINVYDAASGQLLRTFKSPSLNQPSYIVIE